MAVERQTSTLPPAQPSYILRGHASQIHSVRFVRQNSRLITGDADGWVVYWKVETKRALAVWKAHDAAILGLSEWGLENIITHGRDNSLRIWQLRASEDSLLSTVLPAEPTTQQRPKPWLLHTLPVNTLNFCAFSMCYEHDAKKSPDLDKTASEGSANPSSVHRDSILIAVPARDDKKIEVYQFPDERLKSVVPRAQSTDTGTYAHAGTRAEINAPQFDTASVWRSYLKTALTIPGMVMAVKLIHHPSSNNVLLLAGYEGGLTAVFKLTQKNNDSTLEVAEPVYLSQPHTQPILSLEATPDRNTYFTSSADAIIAAHQIPGLAPDRGEEEDYSVFNRVASTAIPSTSISEHQVPVPVKELSPSSYPNGPLPIPAQIVETTPAPSEPLAFSKQSVLPVQTRNKPAGLSFLLSSAPPQLKIKPSPPSPPTVTIQPAYKSTDTRHAGQQSLQVRSDSRLLVTGGWDTRVRIYSTKTLKEVAVLKWHKEGVYAVCFSEILEASDLEQREKGSVDGATQVARRETGLGKLQRQREQQLQLKHWVAAGAKDGKVSLWEVF